MTDLTTWVKFGPFIIVLLKPDEEWLWPVETLYVNGPTFTFVVGQTIASLFEKNILLDYLLLMLH